MKIVKLSIFIIILSALTLEAQVSDHLPAFPQAEGFGAYALGGRGGKVIFVDNLNDDGPGSLRAAVKDPDPRIVIFRVSGTIELQSDLVINHPFITIAGHTAPGDGICLKNFPLKIQHTHDAIVRGIRVRPGIELLEVGTSTDGIAIEYSQNVIVDHCSASWSTDEILNTNNKNADITVQWCIFSESLNNSIQQREHGYAATLGGQRTSIHHNLFAHNKGRNPSIGGGDRGRRSELDITNNVVYNWIYRVCDGKPHNVNFVANYYRPGPATPPNNRKIVAEIQNSERYGFHSQWYIEGNYIEGFPELTADNWNGAVRFRFGCSMKKNRAFTAFENGNYMTRDADQAYLEVLDHAGVIVPRRDVVDNRVIGDVRSGTATFGIGIIDKVEEVGGWPELQTYDVPKDTDNDGMPDAWETKEGLNINDPLDRFGIKKGEVYDNLERYLNQLASNQPFLLPPVELQVSQKKNSEVLLRWKDISKGEQGFCIQRTNSEGHYITVSKVGANKTEFIDSFSGPDGTVVYRVFAYDRERISIVSKPVSIEYKKQ
jgi:pectate lyase